MVSRSTLFVVGVFLFVIVIFPAILYVAANVGVLGGGTDGGVGSGPGVGVGGDETLVVRDEPIVAGNNTLSPIGIHARNLDDSNRTVSIAVRNGGEPLWNRSYRIPPHTELEVQNLIDRKGNYTLELATASGASATQQIEFDLEHDYVAASIGGDNVTINQTLRVT